MLSQEAEIAWSQNALGNWIRLTDSVGPGAVHFHDITCYFGVAMIVVGDDVVGSAVSRFTLGMASRA